MSVAVRNEILARLDPSQFGTLKSNLRVTPLSQGAILQEKGLREDCVHFIEHGLVSNMIQDQGGGALEVTAVGRSGLIGVSVLLGADVASQRSVVLLQGSALSISSDALSNILRRRSDIHDRLLTYVHDLIVQKSQMILCNVRHGIEARLARWLLRTDLETRSSMIPMTHRRLAGVLGVRRSGVSDALAHFEAIGAVALERGNLRLVDCGLLERRACECHKLVGEVFHQTRHRFEHRIAIEQQGGGRARQMEIPSLRSNSGIH